MDTSRFAIESPCPEAVLDAVCLQIIEEIATVRTLPVDQLPLRAAEPWHFLHRIEQRLKAEDRQIVVLLSETPEDHIVFRYDPQLDNFLVKDRHAQSGVWSIDFSMWRRTHFAYPFAFLWHDLVERPRLHLDPQQLQPVILNRLVAWATTTGCNRDQAQAWLLACRAEALAHEVDGHTRRGHSVIAQRKLATLAQTLKELGTCHW